MFTFRFFRNPKNDALHLRITHNRRKAEMELRISATEEAFESAMSDRPRAQYETLSFALKRIESCVKEVQLNFVRDGGIPADTDVKGIREEVRKKLFPQAMLASIEKENEPMVDESRLFGLFYEKRMNAKTNRGYRESCEYTFKKMRAFCADGESDHGKDFGMLTFEDITLKWLNSFDEWLAGKGASRNTRNIHFKNIRTVINRAIDEELTEKYPFRRFKIRPEETRKRSLSVENLRRLFDYPVEEYQKFYLDMFKLTFMLCGINAVDLYGLTGIKDGRIEYRRAKTHKLYSIKVEPEAMEIIERWRGHNKGLLCIDERWSDHRDFYKNMNIALKKIGRREKLPGRGGKEKITKEFPEISSYWARHSWATIARKLKIPKDDIALALGHRTGHDMTDIYIDEDMEAVDVANRRVLDYVLYGKDWREK